MSLNSIQLSILYSVVTKAITLFRRKWSISTSINQYIFHETHYIFRLIFRTDFTMCASKEAPELAVRTLPGEPKSLKIHELKDFFFKKKLHLIMITSIISKRGRV